MKKVLVLAAALALSAAPAVAQQSAVPAVQQQSAIATAAPAPSIFVSPDEIRQRVAAAEAEREGAQLQEGHWWYYAAAIALGVLIAMLLLDS